MWFNKNIILGVLVLVAVTVALSLGALHGEKGLLHYLSLQQQKENLIQSNIEWREKNRKLYEHIERLRHDPGYIEKMARKELGLVKEGELVYIFEPAAPR
jgi:cell division protein FtsB